MAAADVWANADTQDAYKASLKALTLAFIILEGLNAIVYCNNETCKGQFVLPVHPRGPVSAAGLVIPAWAF